MLRDTARPHPWVGLLLGPPRGLQGQREDGILSPHPMPPLSGVHICMCTGWGRGVSCKIQIPGAPIRGQDKSPQALAFYQALSLKRTIWWS